jgi:hypothetical protein
LTTNGVDGRCVHEKSKPAHQLSFRQALRRRATDEQRRSPEWPKDAKVLGGQLRRLAPALRPNVDIRMSRTARARVIDPVRVSETSSSLSSLSFPSEISGLRGDNAPVSSSSSSSGDNDRRPMTTTARRRH